MSVSLSRILPAAVATVVLAASAALPAGAPAAAHDRAALAPADAAPAAKTDPVLFFAADGMRQDLVQHYADHGVMPAMRRLLKKGASATGGGLLTQAPPNTGAGWYSLATGAWPAVTGSTNNTFHINGQPFANRTAAFDPGVLQAESIAQSAERGGKKVAQIEWAGGRGAATQGPDGGLPVVLLRPRRGHELPLRHRRRGVHPVVRVAVRLAGRLRRQRARSRRPPRLRPPAGRTSQRATARRRRCGCGCSTPATDKYGLNVYLYDSTDDGQPNYDRALFARGKDGSAAVANLRQGADRGRQGEDRPAAPSTARPPDSW